MTGATVSQAYLIGISEGRAEMRQFQRNGIPIDLETIARVLENCAQCLAMRPGDELRESFKGQRDFWRHQLAKLTTGGRAK